LAFFPSSGEIGVFITIPDMFNPFSGVESLCSLTFFPRTGYIGFYLSNPPTFSRIAGEESFSAGPFIFG
jgi:hypothetical protein